MSGGNHTTIVHTVIAMDCRTNVQELSAGEGNDLKTLVLVGIIDLLELPVVGLGAVTHAVVK